MGVFVMMALLFGVFGALILGNSHIQPIHRDNIRAISTPLRHRYMPYRQRNLLGNCSAYLTQSRHPCLRLAQLSKGRRCTLGAMSVMSNSRLNFVEAKVALLVSYPAFRNGCLCKNWGVLFVGILVIGALPFGSLSGLLILETRKFVVKLIHKTRVGLAARGPVERPTAQTACTGRRRGRQDPF